MALTTVGATLACGAADARAGTGGGCGQSPRGQLSQSDGQPPNATLRRLAVLRRRPTSKDTLGKRRLRRVPLRVIDRRYVRKLGELPASGGDLFVVPGVMRTRPAVLPRRCARTRSAARKLRIRNRRLRRRHYALCLVIPQRGHSVCSPARVDDGLFVGNLTVSLFDGVARYYALVPDGIATIRLGLTTGETVSTPTARNWWSTTMQQTDPARPPARPASLTWLDAQGTVVEHHDF